MKSEHLVGTSIPRFTFDTPTTPGNDFYKLCEGEHPLVMIFLPAFDHPVTREYLTRYLQTLPRLRGVRLACVVHSSPRTVAKATQGAEFPFTLICDAPGVLYGYLGVEQARGILSWSFAAQRIYKAAREQGYRYDSSAPQLLRVRFNNGDIGVMGGLGFNVRKFFIDFRISGYPRSRVWHDFTSDGVSRRVKVPHDIVYGGSVGFFF